MPTVSPTGRALPMLASALALILTVLPSHVAASGWEKLESTSGAYGLYFASGSTLLGRAADPVSPRDFAVMRSRDGGASWSPLFRSEDYGTKLRTVARGSGLRIQRFAVSPPAPETLYVDATDSNRAGAPEAVYRTSDGGDTWDEI